MSFLSKAAPWGSPLAALQLGRRVPALPQNTAVTPHTPRTSDQSRYLVSSAVDPKSAGPVARTGQSSRHSTEKWGDWHRYRDPEFAAKQGVGYATEDQDAADRAPATLAVLEADITDARYAYRADWIAQLTDSSRRWLQCRRKR